MTCSEFRYRLDTLLAGDLETSRFPGRADRAHLRECQRCTGALTRVLALAEVLGTPKEESELVAAAKRSRDNLRATLERTGHPVIRFDWLPTPVGRVFVGLSAQGVCDVTFGESSEDGYRRRLAARAPEVWRDRTAVADALAEFDAYFSGRSTRFSLRVDLRGLPAFTARVLRATQEIPFGTVLSYGDVARQLGSPSASRAVGGALGRNPVPIIVPCHRVVAQGGKLGGFTGGLEVKKTLLEIEGHPRDLVS